MKYDSTIFQSTVIQVDSTLWTESKAWENATEMKKKFFESSTLPGLALGLEKMFEGNF